MDKIIIRDLLVRCIVGVREHERVNKQDVIINIDLIADLRKAGKSDNLGDSIDYSTIKKRIVTELEDSHYFLVEALAERIADICLENEMVKSVKVTVEKPSALRFARSVGVEINRDRG